MGPLMDVRAYFALGAYVQLYLLGVVYSKKYELEREHEPSESVALTKLKRRRNVCNEATE